MKKSIITMTTAGIVMGAAAASADVTLYGRVLYNAIDDDTAEDLYFGRHEFAESNIGIKGSKKVGSLTIGGQVEIGLNEGVSSLLQNGSNSRNRIQEATVGGAFGKVSLGTGASATWVASDVDQSGTWVSDPLGMSQRFGATRRGPSGQSQTPFVQVQSIFSERLRYDSPKIAGGLTFHGQYGEDSSYELAAKYVGHGVRAAVWNANFGDAEGDGTQADIDGNGTNGFFGAESGSGLLVGYKIIGINFTVAAGVADQVTATGDDNGERSFVNWKLGYTKGKHAVSFSQGNYESEDAAGTSGPDHTRSTVAYNYSPAKSVKMWIQITNGETDGEEEFDATALGIMVKI
ncbi:MAG: porin [Cellvibrionaceae bacterium]